MTIVDSVPIVQEIKSGTRSYFFVLGSRPTPLVALWLFRLSRSKNRLYSYLKVVECNSTTFSVLINNKRVILLLYTRFAYVQDLPFY